MSLNDFLDPVSLKKPEIKYLDQDQTFCHSITIHTPSQPIKKIDNYQFAILGVPESRNTINTTAHLTPDLVRTKLYQLATLTSKKKIIDLGNLKIGKSINDSYLGLREVLIDLISKDITVVIIGGGQNLTYSNYLAYRFLKQKFHLTTIDAKLDLDKIEKELNADNYLKYIFTGDKDNYVFDYINIANQSYFVSPKDLQYLNKRLYNSIRLGNVRGSIDKCEPILRDTHVLSVDFNSIRQSDAPANVRTSPNGLYGEEICQLSRYAGMSDKLKVFGLYEINPSFDIHNQSVHLAAQMIWYFLEGASKRSNEIDNIKSLKKYIVHLDDRERDRMVFYYSKLTDRWWMEITDTESNKKIRIACSKDDYALACKQDIPDRWLQFFKKIN